jgi:hypothetical protein
MSTPDSSTGAVLQAISDDLSRLLRQELAHAQDELAGKARRAGGGAVLLAGAGVLGALAVGTSASALLRALDRLLPRPVAAAALTCVYAAGAGALAVAGVAQIRRALPLVPEETVVDLREDIAAVRDQQ